MYPDMRINFKSAFPTMDAEYQKAANLHHRKKKAMKKVDPPRRPLNLNRQVHSCK